MIKIRPLNRVDLKKVCSLPRTPEELYSFFPKARYPLTEDQLLTAVAARSDSHVVDNGDDIVGFANFYRWGVNATCSIGNVIVSVEARGKGVASSLMQYMIKLAYEKYQASEVTVSCFHYNVAGLLLYSKLGFEPYSIEERLGLNGNRVALIHMRHSQS